MFMYDIITMPMRNVNIMRYRGAETTAPTNKITTRKRNPD